MTPQPAPSAASCASSASMLPFLLGSTLSAVLAACLAAGGGGEPYPVAAPAQAKKPPMGVQALVQE
ncbi:hypothetical protein [Azohydromonas lata]|uniref:Uncharacterized protein n=1 Tax=Azohydromonas lata TaxID=45677 RepID=A0ABU5I8U3_9BURK|nr:hypothetical protein [Azohydromonas lata]MDZ5455522.1 hypothetical protein [Azohydromonas lata]